MSFMVAAEKIEEGTPTISEPLTWEQICERYKEEWVCLVEIDRIHPNNFHFRTARVVGHGKTRREPLVQARPWSEHYTEIGHYFTGPVVGPLPRFSYEV
jgi:hypothetical protein